MFRNWKTSLFALVAVAVVGSLCASEASAQYPVFGWNDWYGNNHVVYNSRLSLGANIAIPGSQRYFSQWVPGVGWVRGTRYMGIDGRWHGNTSVSGPSGSTTHHYYKRR
jgi:hypothetical protein